MCQNFSYTDVDDIKYIVANFAYAIKSRYFTSPIMTNLGEIEEIEQGTHFNHGLDICHLGLSYGG